MLINIMLLKIVLFTMCALNRKQNFIHKKDPGDRRSPINNNLNYKQRKDCMINDRC